jgi:hypothetical protein
VRFEVSRFKDEGETVWHRFIGKKEGGRAALRFIFAWAQEGKRQQRTVWWRKEWWRNGLVPRGGRRPDWAGLGWNHGLGPGGIGPNAGIRGNRRKWRSNEGMGWIEGSDKKAWRKPFQILKLGFEFKIQRFKILLNWIWIGSKLR